MFEVFSKLLPRLKKSKPSRPIITTNENGAEGTYTCRVVMLDGSNSFLDIKLTEKAQVILNQVCSKLRLYEQEFFSLKYIENGIQKWLKLSKSINNQIPGNGPHTFFFCVRFYPMGPSKVLSEIGRYQIYLQIKKDIQHGRLPLPDDVCVTFAALSIQADMGDVDVMDLDATAFSVFKPTQMTIDEFQHNVRQEQKKFEGKISSRAEFMFLEQASWLDHYGVEMHDIKADDGSDLQLGISPIGLILFRDGQKVGAHYWPRLSKISFKNRTLCLRVIVTTGGEETRSYESLDKERCKISYKSCIAHHAFFKLVTSTTHHAQLQDSMKHSSSSSRLFSFGSKISGRDNSGMIPDVVSGQAHHQQSDYSQRLRRSRRNSGSESCPESDRFMPRQSSCTAVPVGRRVDFVSPRNHGSRHYVESSARRMSPVSMHGGFYRYQYGRDDADYISGSECDFTVHRRDRNFHRDNPFYRTTVESRRGRSRPVEDVSFYSEVEREPRSHHRHCRSRSRVYPEEFFEPRRGFGYGNLVYYEGDYLRGSHIYDHLPMDVDDRIDRETTIRWADEQVQGHSERKQPRSQEPQIDLVKRHRKRSQSPGAGSRPPQELASHFRYVDPSEVGANEDQLRDIQYTRVETDISSVPTRYSPRTKNKIRQSRRAANNLRVVSNASGNPAGMPNGEAPPPYLGAGGSPARNLHVVSRSKKERGDSKSSMALQSSLRKLPHSDAYIDTLENYRREVSMRLERRAGTEESSGDAYNDIDGTDSQGGVSRPIMPGSSKACTEAIENYRRETNSRLARSSGPNEAILSWYGSATQELENQRRTPNRNVVESHERVSSVDEAED